MKYTIYILYLLLLINSCKNTSEEQQIADSDVKEQPDFDLKPEVATSTEKTSEEPEHEQEEAREKSVFDIGENYVYVKKDDLDEAEQAVLQKLLESETELTQENLIQDSGSEYSMKLPELRSQLEYNSQSYIALKDILERNISPASVSMGYEIDGRERIREYTGNPNGGFLEDMTEYYMFRGGRAGSTVLRRLGVASKENVVPILLEYFNVREEELAMLRSFPETEEHTNSVMAKNALDFEIPEVVTEYLKSPDCSQGFKETVAFFQKRQVPSAKRFVQNAQKAKDEFYELNPGWYGEEEESGVTYIDARKKYIYLPFGPLSFADELISHDIGTEGANSEGVLNEPEMALEIFRLADPRIGNLGINGVLTVEFTNNALTNVNGPDLYVFEMGKIEPTKLEISKDGKEWLEIGKIEGGTAMVDIAEFVKPGETFNYIRLTDLDTWSTVPGADIDAIAAIGGALRLNIDSSVLFDTAEFELKETASAALEELMEAILEIPNGTIIVEGHTDNVGSPASNVTLSENRAREVADFLKSKLPDNYQYMIKGLGESQPIAPNDTDEDRQKNRRVEILVLPSN